LVNRYFSPNKIKKSSPNSEYIKWRVEHLIKGKEQRSLMIKNREIAVKEDTILRFFPA
jgi:hypothetical protein